MRITTTMISDSFLKDLQTNLQESNTYSQQLTAGRRIIRLSDDPVGVLNSLTARNKLSRNTQYQSNLSSASKWVDQTETCLRELSAKMTDVYDNLLEAASDTRNTADKGNIATIVTQFRDSLMETLNTTVGDQYLFGGYNTNSAPLTLNDEGRVLYNGIDLSDLSAENVEKINTEAGQNVHVEIGFNNQMDVSMTAIEVLGVGDKNLFGLMEKIIDVANSGDADASEQLSGCVNDFLEAQVNVETCLVKAGTMQDKIEILNDRYSESEVTLTKQIDDAQGIDQAETIMQWKYAEAAYEQSLAMGAKIIQPTLLDYLK